MKTILTSTLCLCAALLLCSGEAPAQVNAEEKPAITCFLPFETYGNLSNGDEKALLDNLAIQLLKDREQSARIYVYAGRLACAGEVDAKVKRITHHLVKTRGVEAGRVFVQDGGHREEASVELILWPLAGQLNPPTATPTIDPSDVEIRKDCRPLSRPRRGRQSGSKR
ncbi:MAG TPA: hypothetical protein VGW12_16065 [Pyrinomonadaceae bacterium]|nr:hypothetical protein [Pyrinomonadaceae bacterium]